MTSLPHDYRHLVGRYVASGDEAVLVAINALGAAAVRDELPIEEIADLHHKALFDCLQLDGRAEAIERLSTCLAEFLIAFGLAYRDRTERMLELQRIDSHRQKLEAMGQLAAGVAHEFNNLLQPITGLAELALEDAQDPALSEVLSIILETARKAAWIVRHLLTSVRQMTPEAAPIACGVVVRDQIAFLRRTLPASLTLEAEIHDFDRMILGDARELEQIIDNLVRNAADAVGGRGLVRITVAARPEERTIVLSVEDHGIGMGQETLNRIFEPFFSTKPSGTGLGLAMVKGIIDDWGGKIAVSTKYHVGTTVTVTLPVHEPAVP